MEPLDYRERRLLLAMVLVAVAAVGATTWHYRRTAMVFLPAAGLPAAGVPSVSAQEKPLPPQDGEPPKGTAGPALLDLNTAGLKELETLPGIGPRLAQNIIEYRQKKGGFRRVEELLQVKGIGPVRFEAIKKLVTVGTERAGA